MNGDDRTPMDRVRNFVEENRRAPQSDVDLESLAREWVREWARELTSDDE